jgi:hypothetical protein
MKLFVVCNICDEDIPIIAEETDELGHTIYINPCAPCEESALETGYDSGRRDAFAEIDDADGL